MIDPLRLAVVGLGYWGPNLARVAATELEDVELTMLCDRDPDALARQARRHPGAHVTRDLDTVLESDEVDAVLLATPIATHHELGLRALEAGKHLFVEKPLADTAEQCEDLAAAARERGLVLMPGHTFLYSPPVVRVKEMLASGALGKIYFGTSSRVNLGLHQRDADVVRDLGPHDFSIFLYWLGRPSFVRAVARDAIVPGTMDVAFIDLIYPDGCLVHLELSWLAPTKLRRTVLVATEKMVVYDDMSQEQVRLYDRGIDVGEARNFGEWKLQYREGDIVSPRIPADEPLRVELEDFAGAVREGREPRSNWELGLDVVRLVEATEASLRFNGAPVPLDRPPEDRRKRPDRRLNVSGRPFGPLPTHG